MTAQKRIIATLAGTVVMFLLGWIFYGMAFAGFFEANAGSATGVDRGEDMVWWAIILGNMMQAYLLVYIFGNWAGISTFLGGLKGGFTIGLILGLGMNLVMYATSNLMTLTAALVDPLISGAMYGLAGGVIGMVLGRKS